MEWLLWFSCAVLIYCYLGYPFLIWLGGKFFYLPVNKKMIEPTVSVVISVHNEEDVIADKVKNLFSLEYPKEKIEFLIGSDGSTDRTDVILQGLANAQLRLVAFKERRGKMATLNDLVVQARHEIIVFTDARQEFDRNAVRELVANFHDPKVGCASGELIFRDKDSATAKGINLYWKYEKFIRDCESRVHSMLGATGAIYAIRKELYAPIPEGLVLDDMFVPLKIVEKGYRVVFDGSAKAYDDVADSPREEHRRKARTLYGNYQILFLLRSLMMPLRSPVWLQLFSHKFLRLVAVFFMMILFVINIFLIGDPFYQTLFVLQVIFYMMAVSGALSRYEKYGIFGLIARICYVPYVFCLLNFSALEGFLRFVRGKQNVTWKKARSHEQ